MLGTHRLACFAVLTLASSLSHAEGSEVATARQLAIQGIDAVEGGDCKAGVALLDRAEQLHHASVHLQYLARCRLRAGRLVDATEMWRQVLREGAPAGASAAIQKAVTEAGTQLEQTLPRLATTTVRTEESYPDLTLQLDGKEISPALVGAPQVLDPGDHVLEAHAQGYRPWNKTWKVGEGQAAEIVVQLVPSPGGAGGPGDEGARSDGKGPGASPLVPAGWIGASVGAAALVGGTVTLLMRNNRKSDIESNCSGYECPKNRYESKGALEDDKQAVRDLSLASTVLFIGGGALVAGGVTLIVLGNSSGKGDSHGTATSTALVAGAPDAEAGLSFLGRW